MPHTLDLGTHDTDNPSQTFFTLRSEIHRTNDTKKLQHIHEKICAELAYRLSVPDSHPNPDYHNLANGGLLQILYFVWVKVDEILSREQATRREVWYEYNNLDRGPKYSLIHIVLCMTR